MSILGLPATNVDFWQRHKGTDWPLCDRGPCQCPAILTEVHGKVQGPRCAVHGSEGPVRWFIEPGDLAGTVTTTYRGRR